jgi:hypothetical protein
VKPYQDFRFGSKPIQTAINPDFCGKRGSSAHSLTFYQAKPMLEHAFIFKNLAQFMTQPRLGN